MPSESTNRKPIALLEIKTPDFRSVVESPARGARLTHVDSVAAAPARVE